MSSDELKWRYSLNAGQLFGTKAPPATLGRRVGGATPEITVKRSAEYNEARYMNRQAGESGRRNMIEYLRHMISLVDLPTISSPAAAPSTGTEDPITPALQSDEADGVVQYVGVITQLNDQHSMSTADRNAPWEFYSITDPLDDDQYDAVLEALSLSRANSNAFDEAAESANSITPAGTGQRLSLFCGNVPRFTCMYPGIAVGIRGVPNRRDMDGRITALMVREIIPPRKPNPTWKVLHKATSPSASWPSFRPPIRVTFCTGPFPRRALFDIIRSLVEHAVQRQSSVLIIGGPLVPQFEDSERASLINVKTTLSEHIAEAVNAADEEINRIGATNPVVKELKIVFVPSLEDVMQVPVLPQPNYGVELETETNVILASNPCVVNVGGVRIGVVNYDTISDMREQMVERMHGVEEGSLHRVAESVVSSRLYVPMMEFPSRCVDTLHLCNMAMCSSVFPSLTVAPSSKPSTTIHAGDHAVEGASTSSPLTTSTTSVPPLEDIPHILFLPSLKPTFAFTSHAFGEDLSDKKGTGPLLVNPMVWNAKRKQPFMLNVVEITITDTSAAVERGIADEASGTSVVAFSAYRE